MTSEQRDRFKLELKKFRAAIEGDISQRREFENTWQAFSPIIGLALGGAGEISTGISGLVAAGLLGGWSIHLYFERLDDKQRRLLFDCLERCDQLLSETRVSHQDIFRLPDTDPRNPSTPS